MEAAQLSSGNIFVILWQGLLTNSPTIMFQPINFFYLSLCLKSFNLSWIIFFVALLMIFSQLN